MSRDREAHVFDGDINDAISHYGEGRLPQAKEICQKILADDPDHPKALSMLGVIACAFGDAERAVELVSRAIQVKPDYAEAHNNLGNLLRDLGRFAEAEVSYLRALEIKPEYAEAHNNLGTTLFALGRFGAAAASYRQALAISPELAEAHNNLGGALQEQGLVDEAVASFQKAIAIQPGDQETRANLNRLQTKQVPSWHFPMMNDSARNAVYEEALKAVITPASRVLDIGSGSGLLAMMAARAGAATVTTTEKVPQIAKKAREIVEKNGYGDTITVRDKFSTSLIVGKDMAEKANVMVSEIFDDGLLGEGAIQTIKHARANLLTEDAVIIPSSAKVKGVLLESEAIYHEGQVDEVSGFDLSPFNEFSPFYLEKFIPHYPHRFLSEPFDVFEFDFLGENINSESKTITLMPKKEGVCHGVAFWYRLFLDENRWYDTYNIETTDCHWLQAIQLLPEPRNVTPRQEVQIIASHDTRLISFVVEPNG